MNDCEASEEGLTEFVFVYEFELAPLPPLRRLAGTTGWDPEEDE